MSTNTDRQFAEAMKMARDVFAAKLRDYGASWRLMRPSTVTDQIFIKAKRIRSLEIKKHSEVGEGILPEFVAIINYSIVAIIQLHEGFVDTKDMDYDQAMGLYDKVAKEAYELMVKKNHDYGDAWRDMRVSSYTDFILTKLERVKEIEDNGGLTEVSEGVESNYLDMLNYAVFGVIKLM